MHQVIAILAELQRFYLTIFFSNLCATFEDSMDTSHLAALDRLFDPTALLASCKPCTNLIDRASLCLHTTYGPAQILIVTLTPTASP